MPAAMLRTLYRAAYWLLWLASPVYQPRKRGVKCLLINDGAVLLVRHTYGPRRWDLPGGGLRRGEDPNSGIQREIREELGVEIEDERVLWPRGGAARHAPARVTYFAAELADRSLRRDPIEIAEAQWCDPLAPPAPLGMHAARVLARHGESIASRASDPGSPARG